MNKLLVSSLGCFLLICSASAQSYTYTDLHTLPPYNLFVPAGINNEGNVVGTAYDEFGRNVAFRYLYGSLSVVASPGPSHSAWGNAINDTNTIVGGCERTGHPSGSTSHAFYATQGAGAVDFDSNFQRRSEAKAINNSGYIVGLASGQSFIGHLSGWFYLLGPAFGNDFQVSDLNNHWTLVGTGSSGGLSYDAATGAVIYLGEHLGSWNNEANAVNDAGTVAGKVGSQGYLFSNGVVTRFGQDIAEVNGLNASEDVVGTTGDNHAFVYHKASGAFVDLNTVIDASISATWTLIAAAGINDRGEICGQARRLATMEDHAGFAVYIYTAFKLTPQASSR